MIPNGPVFSSQDSLNSYKTGDHKQKLYQYQKEQTALSHITHHVPSSVPAAKKSSSSWLWQCSVQAQAVRLGMCQGFTSLRWFLWPEPRAGEGSAAAEMLQAGSAVAPGMVDAPGLVPQGWDWISDSICALHWDPVFNISGTFVHTVPKCLWNFSWSFLNRSFAEAAHLHLI